MNRKHAKIDAISYDPVNGVSNPFDESDDSPCAGLGDWSCVMDYCEWENRRFAFGGGLIRR